MAGYNSGYSYDRSYSAPQNRGRAPYRSNGYSNSNRSGKKHSGCRSKSIPDFGTVVSAWNYSKTRGLITVYARPYKGTNVHESGTGKRWMNYFVTITNTRTMQVTNTSGLFDCSNNRVYIKDLNLVMSPNKNYFGTHIRKNR